MALPHGAVGWSAVCDRGISQSYSGDGSRISGKGVLMYKSVGIHFADFISFFLNIL